MEAAVKQTLGRYALYGVIATGGMATVHFARSFGTAGFARTVAIKRLHPHLSRDPEFVSMFLDEAHIVSRINHPNVVNTIDVVNEGDELFIVMEYVHGEALSRLVRALKLAGGLVPPHVAASVVCGALEGLHAAHEARSDKGEPLGIVHRDISPQNILVGADGVTRVLDFGVAKANSRLAQTSDGSVKGKLAYMSPEQVGRGVVDRRADVFATGVVLWEILTGRRLFQADDPAAVVASIMTAPVEPPSALRPELPPAVDAVVLKALAREPTDRFESAREMAIALEGALPVASARQVAAWVEQIGADALASRAEELARVEAESSDPSLRVAPALVAPASGPQPAARPYPVAPESAGAMRGATLSSPSHPSSVSSPGVPSGPVSFERPKRSGAAIAIALGALFALLAVAGAALLGWKMRDASPARAAPSGGASAVVAPEVPIVPVAPAPAPASPPSTAAAIAEPPTPSSTAPAGKGRAPVRAPVTKATASAPPKPAAAPPSCENPFVIGADGVRRPKPECFR